MSSSIAEVRPVHRGIRLKIRDDGASCAGFFSDCRRKRSACSDGAACTGIFPARSAFSILTVKYRLTRLQCRTLFFKRNRKKERE